MKHGFVKVCAATPEVKVADCRFNSAEIIKSIQRAAEEGAKIAVFPELCVTGYTCGDLFLQDALICAAKEAVLKIAKATALFNMTIVIGAPITVGQKLYNCAAILYRGKVVAIIPKSNIPNYGEFSEIRHFACGTDETKMIVFGDECVPFGTKILIKDRNVQNLALAVEICEDLEVTAPPSGMHSAAGATVIANLSASNEFVEKALKRKNLVVSQSERTIGGYIYAAAGVGESTTDTVYGGDSIICENGKLLARKNRFENGIVFSEIDVDMLAFERRRISTFEQGEDYYIVETELETEETGLTRTVKRLPFLPENEQNIKEYCNEILQIQSNALARRLFHTGAKTAVIGISGGLDSTLALIVAARAFDIAGLDRRNILAVTMPCFGTTKRTYDNAVALSNEMGATLSEINIKAAVLQHFEDIGQDKEKFDVTFENAQARERTQVLMDVANKTGGVVIGTGDMSELALGWATYNGDHMSMYGVNSGVPKTVIRYLIEYEAHRLESAELKKVLTDILNTPVSPELLPPENGEISQKTEQFVGPYILHDFFLYYMMRFGFAPEKIYRLAKCAFSGEFTDSEILEWMKVFYRRFFSQQFKRSCLPDGPKVTEISLSPRGGLQMPSDASGSVWINEIDILLQKSPRKN